MDSHGFRRTSADAALRLMFLACDQDRPYTVFDARDAHSYGHGHFPDAVTLNEHDVGAWLRRLPPAQPVFIYCGLGFSSQTFAKRFADAGFREVHSIDGGFPALVKAFKQAREEALHGEAATASEGPMAA